MGKVEVFLIDNATQPPISQTVLLPLVSKNISCKLIREERLGIQFARIAAVKASSAPTVLWIDDDNILDPAYVEIGVNYAKNHPEVGCFGGQLLLPKDLQVKKSLQLFLPYLAIRDLGDDGLVTEAKSWTPAQPPTAGAFVRRNVLRRYAERSKHKDANRLGRVGLDGLGSAEDSLMMRSAYDLNLKFAYVPDLWLFHCIDTRRRLRFFYLMELMYGTGQGNIILERLMNGQTKIPAYYASTLKFIDLLRHELFKYPRHSFLFCCGMVAYQFGVRKEYLAATEIPDIHKPKLKRGKSTKRNRITLVTAALNADATLERTLKSVKAQRYKNLEYIFVDGQSRDNTLEIVKNYHKLFTKIICEPDNGVAEAINKGLKIATGEIIGFLNADDELAPYALQTISQFFEENPEIDVVSGSCKRVFADGSTFVNEVPEAFLNDMALRNLIDQPSTFWRKTMQDKHGFLDETYKLAFDMEWWNRLKKGGAKFAIVKPIISVYHFSETNLTSKAGMQIIHEMYRVTKEYGPLKGLPADLYMTLFKWFDLKGCYDVPRSRLPFAKRIMFELALKLSGVLFGRQIVDAYNWNWASKQVRGLIWYK